MQDPQIDYIINQAAYLLLLIAAYIVYNIVLAVGIYLDAKKRNVSGKFYWILLVLAFNKIGVRMYEKHHGLTPSVIPGDTETQPVPIEELPEKTSIWNKHIGFQFSKKTEKRIIIFFIFFNLTWILLLVIMPFLSLVFK